MDTNEELKIRNTILEMEKPFKLSDLFIRLSKEGIDNRDWILEVLDDLCDRGLIAYSEIIKNCWAYVSKFPRAI